MVDLAYEIAIQVENQTIIIELLEVVYMSTLFICVTFKDNYFCRVLYELHYEVIF